MKKHICLVTASLERQGSANAILALMANHWANSGHKVTILTFDPESEPYYQLDEAIEYKTLNLFYSSTSILGAVLNFFSRFFTIRKTIKSLRPDIVISLLDDPSTRVILATRGLGVPVVGVVHTDPSSYKLPGIWSTFRNIAYPMADSIVVLTNRILDNLPDSIRKRATVIPNPVTCPPQSHTGITTNRPIILSVGRLIELKRHDLLIRTFSKLAEAHPDWSLVIVGDGPLQDELSELARELGIEDNVRFPGYTATVGDWFQQADIFAMPSLYEGFPLALCEAMAMGAPSVVTDYPAGPDSIITDQKDGIIIPLHDEVALADALDRLMRDSAERERMGQAAKAVKDRFSPKQVLGMWDKLVESLTQETGERQA